MYDFDNDGYLTGEDIRIMMSYMPFKRNVKTSPVIKLQQVPEDRRQKYKEGLYEDDEGKNVAYSDRITDQEEIKKFLDDIFQAQHAGCDGKRMNYKQFEYINKTISSEMFYSLMA